MRPSGRSASPGTRPLWPRAVLLALGFLALAAGVWGGLLRLGLSIAVPETDLANLHGPLMISGFFGVLISLERAVALRACWAYLIPLGAGAGGVTLLFGVAWPAGPVLMALASIGLVAESLFICRLQPALFTTIMAVGAACWAAGNLLWIGGATMPSVVAWWMLFLVLTIAAERLELRRILRPTRWERPLFFGAIGLLLISAPAMTIAPDAGWPVLGSGLAALGLWLLCYDVARRTVRQTGLARYVGLGLLSGHTWLVAAGALAMTQPLINVLWSYDAILHAVFLGFVFAMVFAHAPIILPAVLRVPLPYHPVFYGHVVLLHLSLILRIAGDFADWYVLRATGGVLNAIAIALFLAVTISTVAWAKAAAATRADGTTLPRREV